MSILAQEEASPINYNDLDKIFKRIDKNGDGYVSLDELNLLLESISVQLTHVELGSLIGKPSLDLNEFVLFYFSISNRSREKNEDEGDDDGDLLKAFQVFGANGDGYITCEELQTVLCKLGLWEESYGRDCKKMIFVFDTNSDGKLDFEEFKNMMFHTTST